MDEVWSERWDVIRETGKEQDKLARKIANILEDFREKTGFRAEGIDIVRNGSHAKLTIRFYPHIVTGTSDMWAKPLVKDLGVVKYSA